MFISSGSISATIATDTGNQVQSLKINGHQILWMPGEPNKLGGIPLLAPWANRLDGDSYLANGKRYRLNPEVALIRRDGNGLPIHGLLLFCDGWRVIAQNESSVTSRLEFWRRSEWMAQFPFAHTIDISHRIVDDAFCIDTTIENHSVEPMPLCIGFHPYIQLTDSPRDDWKLTIPARQSVVLSDKLIPTGETKPNDLPRTLALAGISLDAVFTDLTGEAFVIEGKRQKIAVRFGPEYPVAIVYAPQGKPFVCIEPMTAVTNAFNRSGPLVHIAPGATWSESFGIDFAGF